MNHCNIASTPRKLNLKLFNFQTSQNDFEQHKMSNISYAQKVGMLIYASYIACLDLSYAIGEIS